MALLTGHLIGDFVLQSGGSLVEHKTKNPLWIVVHAHRYWRDMGVPRRSDPAPHVARPDLVRHSALVSYHSGQLLGTTMGIAVYEGSGGSEMVCTPIAPETIKGSGMKTRGRSIYNGM